MIEDFLPPHDTEAEQGALGSILIAPTDGMEQFFLLVKSGYEVFYDLRHQRIFQAMTTLAQAKKPIDVISLKVELTRLNQFEEVGGLAYLTGLPECSPSSLNLTYYVETLIEKYTIRRMMNFCAKFNLRFRDYQGKSEDLLTEFEIESLAIRQAVESGRDSADLATELRALMVDYEDAMKRSRPPGVQSGFKEVDGILGGFLPQQLILIGASPSSGKTAFALNILEHAILYQGIKVGFASLETSTKKILHRINSSVIRVDGSRLLRGTAPQEDLTKVVEAIKKNGRVTKVIEGLMVSDRGGLSISQIGGLFRKFYKAGARLFILDYLQLLTSGRNNGARRTEEMTLVSTGLKGIAKDLNCPLLVVSSINRDSMKEDRKPRLSDLRDSGQLEFDADICILLHRLDAKFDVRSINVDVAKNKDGPTGETKLAFFPPQMRFCSPDDVDK